MQPVRRVALMTSQHSRNRPVTIMFWHGYHWRRFSAAGGGI